MSPIHIQESSQKIAVKILAVVNVGNNGENVQSQTRPVAFLEFVVPTNRQQPRILQKTSQATDKFRKASCFGFTLFEVCSGHLLKGFVVTSPARDCLYPSRSDGVDRNRLLN